MPDHPTLSVDQGAPWREVGVEGEHAAGRRIELGAIGEDGHRDLPFAARARETGIVASTLGVIVPLL